MCLQNVHICNILLQLNIEKKNVKDFWKNKTKDSKLYFHQDSIHYHF